MGFESMAFLLVPQRSSRESLVGKVCTNIVQRIGMQGLWLWRDTSKYAA